MRKNTNIRIESAAASPIQISSLFVSSDCPTSEGGLTAEPRWTAVPESWKARCAMLHPYIESNHATVTVNHARFCASRRISFGHDD